MKRRGGKKEGEWGMGEKEGGWRGKVEEEGSGGRRGGSEGGERYRGKHIYRIAGLFCGRKFSRMAGISVFRE